MHMQVLIAQGNLCPLCNKKAKSKMGKVSGYWYCTFCSLGWIKQIPKTSYQEEYYLSGSTFLSNLFSPIANLFYKIRESYTPSPRKKLSIDVGAGDGNYLEKVTAGKKIGVEISSAGRATMKKKGLEVMTNDAFLKKKNLNADTISFWHVLEHVNHPAKYIEAAEKNLKQKGKIVIAIPNIESFEFKLFHKYWFHLAPKYHVWHFSPGSMKKFLNNANLKVEKIDYFAIEHHLTGLIQSFINKTTGSEDILHKLIKRRQNLHTLQTNQIFFVFFWLTLGLPIVLLFWIVSAVLHKPGTFVIVASKNSR